jgi:hypothetical protein
MKPSEFREARRKLDLSALELGVILDTDPRTIRKWARNDGTRPPNPIACRVMQWMLDGWRPPEWPDRLKDKDTNALAMEREMCAEIADKREEQNQIAVDNNQDCPQTRALFSLLAGEAKAIATAIRARKT